MTARRQHGRLVQLVLIACAVGTVACTGSGYGDGPTSAPSGTTIEAIRVTPQSVQFDTLGSTRQLTVALAPATASIADVIWESANPTIVSVDERGVITATGFGAGVLVTAHSRDRRHESSVAVSVGQ